MSKKTASFTQSIHKIVLSGFVALLISTPASFTIAADLSDVPLFVSVNVPSNVFFELDNSGSMDWEILTTKHWHACAYDSNYPGGGEGSFECGWEVDNGLWHGHHDGHRHYEYIFNNSDSSYTSQCTGANNGTSLSRCDTNINNTPYQNDWRILSSDMNVMYYNPALNYEPWDGACSIDGGKCTDADFTSALSNPREGSDGHTVTTDLTGFVYEVWLDDKGFLDDRPQRGTELNIGEEANGRIDLWDSHTKYTVNADSITVERISYAPDATGLNRTVAVPDMENPAVLDGTTCYTELDIPGDDKACLTVADAKANIANWYQFARKRAFVAKGAIAKVVKGNPNFRYGLQMISQDDIMTRMPLKNTTDYESHNKTLLENLFDYTWVSNGTRLRQGLENAGQYYDATDSDYAPTGTEENPIIHHCQKCFTILITDGYWNGDAPGVGDSDGDGISNTLADVAKYYYDKDLDEDFDNVVPDDDFDTNKKQHMVTFTVAFGVEGNLVDTDEKPDGWPNPPLSESGNWGDPTACSGCPEKIDDMWHAAFNSKGGFISAKNPQDLVDSLEKTLKNIKLRTASASPVALSAGSIGNDTKIFQAQFDSIDWHGELYAKALDINGDILAEEWKASDQLPDHGERTILSHNGADPINFEWSNCTNTTTPLSDTQQLALNTNIDGNNDGKGCERLNYLRGDTSNEDNEDDPFRSRPNGVLGDIINSQPIYVGQPNFRYPDSIEPTTLESPLKLYSTFKQTPRPHMIYVGANDGMLHGFLASDGVEKVAYVPSMVYDNLSALTSPDYRHKYYVDGTPTVGDAYINGAWSTVLVSGLNKGGKGIFALDVTNPSSFGTSSVLWEFTDPDYPDDLGYTYGRPNIGKMNDSAGSWAAVFGNGYGSANGEAILYIVDLATGAELAKIKTGVTGDNGLSTPTLLDTNGDNLIDTVYAGDLKGNLWKFDVSNKLTSKWEVAFKQGNTLKPLFTAESPTGSVPQPITTRPNIALGPNGTDWMIIFGTGRYLGSTDTLDTNKQTVYGIIDEGVAVEGRTDLLQQTILSSENNLRTSTNHPLEDSHKGWSMDLDDLGERMVNNMVLRRDRLIFVTTIPELEACNGGGSSWFMEISPSTGSRLSYPPYDINGDGEIDGNDLVNGIPPTGKGITSGDPDTSSDTGLATTPTVGMCGGKECKFTSTTTGAIDMLINDPPFNIGRQSWRQLK